MTILFTQYWDVNPGEYDDYSKFVSEEFNPMLEKLGIKLVGGFYVAVGSGPRIMAVAAVQNDMGLLAALSSREYRMISTRLMKYIYNYGSKVWIPTGMFRKSNLQHSDGGLEVQPVLRHRSGQGGRAQPVRQGGGHSHDEGSGGSRDPRLAAFHRNGTENPCGMHGPYPFDIAKPSTTSEYRKLSRTMIKQYATHFSSQHPGPTGRVEVPYLIMGMMKKF
jgi:hypothetical protein